MTPDTTPPSDDSRSDADVFTARVRSASKAELLELALSLARVHALAPFPGWHFGIEEEDPSDPLVAQRLAIWTESRRRELGTPVPVPWHFGLRLPLWLGNDVSRCLFVGTCLEPNELSYVASVLGPGMTFLDGGANEGIYSLLASALVGSSGRVVSVEPSPREFIRLEAAVALNDLTNVTCLPVALSDSVGTAELNIAEWEHSGHNSLGSFLYEIAAVGSEPVDTVTIDSLADTQGLQRLDLIKLDVEGAELRSLQGAAQILEKFRPQVLFELSTRLPAAAADDLLSFLIDRSYWIRTFDDDTGRLSDWKSGKRRSGNLVAVPK